MSISAAVYPKLAYHPTKNFVPLSMIANFPLIMVGQTTIAPKTVAELVAYAKANPNKSNYGTTSPAFTISSELFKLKTGAPGVALPLKSSAEMILCVIQEQCLFSISDGPPAIPQIKGRQGARDCGHRIGALARIAGRAQHGRKRVPGGHRQAVERHVRAGLDAARDRQQAAGGVLARDPRSGRSPASCAAWRSIGRWHVG
jgi:hypothetical protein